MVVEEPGSRETAVVVRRLWSMVVGGGRVVVTWWCRGDVVGLGEGEVVVVVVSKATPRLVFASEWGWVIRR